MLFSTAAVSVGLPIGLSTATFSVVPLSSLSDVENPLGIRWCFLTGSMLNSNSFGESHELAASASKVRSGDGDSMIFFS